MYQSIISELIVGLILAIKWKNVIQNFERFFGGVFMKKKVLCESILLLGYIINQLKGSIGMMEFFFMICLPGRKTSTDPRLAANPDSAFLKCLSNNIYPVSRGSVLDNVSIFV